MDSTQDRETTNPSRDVTISREKYPIIGEVNIKSDDEGKKVDRVTSSFFFLIIIFAYWKVIAGSFDACSTQIRHALNLTRIFLNPAGF